MSKKGFPSAFFFSLREKRKFIGVSLLFSTNLLCKFVERWRKRKEIANQRLAWRLLRNRLFSLS